MTVLFMSVIRTRVYEPATDIYSLCTHLTTHKALTQNIFDFIIPVMALQSLIRINSEVGVLGNRHAQSINEFEGRLLTLVNTNALWNNTADTVVTDWNINMMCFTFSLQ